MNIETYPDTTRLRKQFTNEIIDSAEKYGPIYEAEPGNTNQMGVMVEDYGCNVAIWAGTADIVDVCLYDTEDHDKTLGRWGLAKENDEDDVFCGFIPGMQVGDIYGLRAHGEWDPANHRIYNYNKLLVDPYARAMTGSFDATIDGLPNPHVNEQVVSSSLSLH